MSNVSREGEGLIIKKYPRLSPQHDEFKAFYTRLLTSTLQGKSLKECILFLCGKLHNVPSIPKDLASLYQDNITELSLIHISLLLFQDYVDKKSTILKAKINKARDALPVYKFKDQIISTIQSNNVVLIAGTNKTYNQNIKL